MRREINGAIQLEQMSAALPIRPPDSQLFRDVFNASPIGVAVENLEGQPLFVNPALCSMLGFSEEELQSKHCVDFSPPEDAEKDRALFQQLRAGSIDHYQLEKRYFRRDGSLVWGRLSISLLNSRPSPLVLAMVEDITDKRKAEEARFRHAAVIESSDDAIASGTLDGIIVSWNTGAQKIYGYTKAEAIGKPISMLVPPELPDEETKILEMLRAGDHIHHFETVRVTKSGKRINVSLTISPIKDSSGRTVGCAGIARDISQRKHAEEALHESEERFRLAAQAGKMFAYEWDAATDKIVRSEGVTRILGVDAGVHTTGQDVLRGVPPEDRARLLAATAQLSPEKPHLRITYRMVRSDGRVIWVERTSRAYFDGHGRKLRIVGMIADITERKLAEAALADVSRKLLEAQEQERNRIGRELHDDVSQQLAMLAVDLEQLRDNPSEVQSRVQELLKQTTELSDGVQALSHELHSSKLEYLGVVGGIKSWVTEFGQRQRMEVDFKHEISSAVPFEVGLCLFRVLQEAVHNATKYSGVKRIEVQLVEHANEVHLIINDSGRGFDIEAARRGRGLGLTSMQERVKLVNGAITIESKPSAGTSIRVRVPLKSEHNPQRAAG